MSGRVRELLDRNDAHVDQGSDERLADHVDGQEPPVVSICCSDSRVSQEGMFDVERPGWLFAPSTIGNQDRDVVDGGLVVDGSLLYPLLNTGTRTAVVVGHTGCGAVTAALAAHRGDLGAVPAGVRKWIDLLEPIVADALEAGTVDVDADEAELVDQLVERNVQAQARFLAEAPEVPDDVEVYGLVYDLTGAYGGPKGRTYLVWAGGAAAEDTIERVRKERPEAVRSLFG